MTVRLHSVGFIFLGACAVLIWIGWYPRSNSMQLRIGETTLRVVVADSPAEIQRGLAGVRMLEANEGMWFELPVPGEHTFWMMGMVMPIDLVWVRNGAVVGVEHGMQPDNGERLYPSPGVVDRVLEIGAGRATVLGIQPGQPVELQP